MSTYDEAWRALTGRTDDWGGCAQRDAVERIAALIVPSGSILGEIGDERAAQDAKWGVPKDVPNGTGPAEKFMGHRFSDLRYWVQGSVDLAADRGDSRMAWVLLEEVFEALAERDDERLREELIQVAAVAAKWVQIIDARSSR